MDRLESFIVNNAQRILTLASASLEHGKFMSEPRQEIPQDWKDTKQSEFIVQSRDYSLVGVKGVLEYNIIWTTPAKLRIEFDIPFIGTNSLIATIDGSTTSYTVSVIKGGDWEQSTGSKILTAVIQLSLSPDALVALDIENSVEEFIFSSSEAIRLSAQIPSMLIDIKPD